MKLVVGTDFSENARAACATGAALARRWSDTLALAHVVDESMSQRLPEEIRETLAASTNDRLHGEAGQFGLEGAKVEEHILSGAPEQALKNLAVQSDARLVIVSSVGHRAGDWLLGSVAERTAEASPVPTLVVRSAAPFEAWARGERALKIFIAVDFTIASDRAVQWVKNLLAAGPCEIVLGYVDWPLGDEPRLGLGWTPLLSHEAPEVHTILKRELHDRAVTVLGKTDVRVRSEPSMGRPDVRLIEIAAEEQADLIVTGTHQRRGVTRLWHPSISRALLRYAPMSVLCVPVVSGEGLPQHSAPIRRVLVAVDLNEHGGRAVPYAYGVVNSGGIVRLVHVTTPYNGTLPPRGRHPHPAAFPPESHALELAETKRRLELLAPEDAAARGIVTEPAVLEAEDVADAIRQAADHFGADVVCVGAHSRSDLSRTLLGSVAKAVMTRSRRPVLIVRDPPP
jgi:nucleotide-binding universal stress UspA family protein